MAVVEWVGSTSGDVSVATNYLGGVAPVGGDDVIARVNPVNPMTTGTFPNLVNFYVGPDYRANIGNTAGQPTFGNVTNFIWAGGGQYCKISSTGTLTTLKANMSNGSELVLSAGTYSAIQTTAGRVRIAAACVLTSCAIKSTGGTRWEVEGSGGTIASMIGTGIARVASRVLTLVEWNGTSSQFTTLLTSTITTGKFLDCVYNPQGSGTDTTVDLRGRARLTLKGNPNSSKTVTTLNVHSGDGAMYTPVLGVTTLAGTVVPIGDDSYMDGTLTPG